MQRAELKLLVAGIILLFVNVMILVVYFEVIRVTSELEYSIDIIFFANGRYRDELQHKLWKKYFHTDAHINYRIIHTINQPLPQTEMLMNVRRYETTRTSEKDIFMHLNEIIPNDEANQKSMKFIWASDKVVPIQNIKPAFFERNKNGSRYFGGLQADAILLNIQHLFEPTLPVCLLEYYKLTQYQSYESFIGHFLSSRHHIYSGVTQELLLPNGKNKAKTIAYREMFQIAHLDPTHPDQHQLNETLKKIWASYI